MLTFPCARRQSGGADSEIVAITGARNRLCLGATESPKASPRTEFNDGPKVEVEVEV